MHVSRHPLQEADIPLGAVAAEDEALIRLDLKEMPEEEGL